MSLAEVTDPADLDWGALRSAADDRRDWREAWGIVGTNHTGDATPGEVYLLSVARHKSATAAALHHWRKAGMESGTIFIGADAARAWARIKGIAAWESSARAQYDERGNRRGRLQAAVREQLVDAARDAATQARLYGRGISTPRMVGGPFGGDTFEALRQRGEDDAMTRGNGGVVGVLNNPYLSAAAQHGEITGTLSIAAATRTIAGVRAATRETARQIDAMTRTINPAPRGPQPRRRR